MENLKQNMLMYSKKSSIRERFESSKKKQHVEPTLSSSYKDKPMTSKQSEQVGDELEEMAQTVLNLFPDYEKEFIKVNQLVLSACSHVEFVPDLLFFVLEMHKIF
jgi:hypothetical protein